MRVTRLSAGLLTTILGLAGAAVGASGAHAAQEWQPVADLSRATESIRGAETAVDPRGGFVAGWVRGGGREASVFLATRPEGGTWGAPARVPGTRGVGEFRLAIAGDGERVLVWTTGRVVKAARQAPGSAWTEPAVLHRTRDGVLPAYVDLAVNQRGRAVVAWQTADDDADLERLRSRAQAVIGDATGRWSAVRTLSSRADAALPEVAVDRHGRATVAWAERVGRRSWVVTASHEVGEGWGASAALSRRTGDAGIPHLAANAAGEVAVAWYVRGDDFTAIRLRRWDASSGWLRAATVPDVRVDIWWVDAAMDGDGTVTVAWSNEAHAVWSATQDGSGAWSRQRIAPVGSVYYGMTVVVNPLGDTLVGWQAKGGASHPVQVAHRPRASGWGGAVVLSAVPGNAYGPALAISRHGDAVAAWTFERGRTGATRVQARILDAG